MLAKNPLLRYLDYECLITELRNAADGLKEPPFAMEETGGQFRTTGHIPVVIARNNPVPLIIMVSLSVLLALGAMIFVMTQRKNPAPQAASQPAAALQNENGARTWDFKYHNVNAKAVLLAGNFNSWHPEAMNNLGGGNWGLGKELPGNEVIEYQFIADGRRQPDPQKMSGAIADENGVLKSVMKIPQAGSPR
jgi:hypothetical protein